MSRRPFPIQVCVAPSQPVAVPIQDAIEQSGGEFRSFTDVVGLNTCTKEETRDIYELVEGRSRTRSTIYCSQYREPGWLERLGGGTSAEGIVDRITNNCYSAALSGDVNMRELTSRVAR